MPSTDYIDDPRIRDDEYVYRRVGSAEWSWIEGRPSSAGFHDSSDRTPMSVGVHSLLIEAGLTPRSLLAAYPQCGLVRFTAGQARRLGLAVTALPRVDGEPAHGWVVGKKKQSIRRHLARQSEIVVLPPRSE